MKPDLLLKYGEARLPRYTSYPTAPHFADGVTAETYGEWLAELPRDEAVSLYLHIPFCRSMCWYCGCHTTIVARDQPIVDYLDTLQQEIALVAARSGRLPVSMVHFGGGTPTIIEPEEFTGLMALLRQHYDLLPDAEIAVEIDPRRMEPAMATALGASGVNRASLGVQSFDPVVQKAINRIQSVEQTAAAVNALRGAGVRRINFDLIYGLPYQDTASCIATATAAAEMRPARFAVFGYAHVPSFKKHQRLIEEEALPDTAARAEQAEAIAATLVAAGYRQIGLDHFALPEDDLVTAQEAGELRRNFQGYTTDTCATLLGFGASAIGQSRAGYVQNSVPLGHYADHVAAGRLATAKGYRLTADDRLRAAIIERLMCDFTADVAAICAEHGADPAPLLAAPRLAELMADGAVTVVDGVVSMADSHRFLIRAVAAAFDAYLDAPTAIPRTHARTA